MSIGVRAAGCVLLGLAVAIIGFSTRDATTSRAASSGLAVTPPSQVVRVGEPVKLDISVSGVADLAAWEVVLKYDPSVLSFSTYTPTDWLASSGRSPTCPSPIVNATLGTAEFGCVTAGSSTPAGVDGGGIVAHVTLNANTTGTSDLEIVKLALTNWDADDCCGAPAVTEGAVKVVAAGDSDPGDSTLPATPTPNAAKRTPTAISGLDGDSLTLGPGANATAAAGGISGGGSGSGGGGGGAPVGVTSGGSSGGGLFGSGTAGQPRSGTGAPHAGTGTVTGVPSKVSLAVAAALAVLGAACLLGAGARPLARALVRRLR